MESLPLLPVEKILKNLDVADLLACSLVSVRLRSMVNNDRIWQKICFKQCSKITIDYIQSVPSTVLPTFKNPEPQHTNLEPLSYWRKLFMKIQHVKHNWCLANHDVHNVTEFALRNYDLKIDNNLLVAVANDNQIDVWNIERVPYIQETLTCALKNVQCKCRVHLGDDRLVIIQDTLMQVYFRSDKVFKLSFRLLFNLLEVDSEHIPRSLNIDEWYNEKVEVRPIHLLTYYVGRYFIGLASNGNFASTSFHIWDTISGTKLKEQSVNELSPNINDPIHKVKFLPPKSDFGKILVCVQHRQENSNVGNYTIVYVYDLLSLTFRRILVIKPHVPWIYYEDHLIITISPTQVKLTIYDSSCGKVLFFIHCVTLINTDSVQVHGDHLGFSAGSKLTVVRLTDFQLVFATDIVKFSSTLFGFDFVFLDWNLILISHWDTTNKIEVWSIDKKCLLSTLKTTGLMFPRNSCNQYNSAKFFVWNEMVTTIYMLQFW